jgi:hypothetical protein
MTEFVAKLELSWKKRETVLAGINTRAGFFPERKMQDVVKEANELVAIFVSSVALRFTSAI